VKLKIRGTRGVVKELAPHHSKHSGVLIDGRVLLDLGESEYLDYKPKAIFITHLHPDHAFFILGQATAPTPTDIPIYAPEGHKNVKIEILNGPISLGSYKITPFPTIHSKKFRSQGYVVEKNSQKLIYTGDLIRIDKEHYNLLENADLVITDGSHLRKGGRVFRDKVTGQVYGHTGIPNLIEFFSGFTANILFLHFGSWFYEDVSGSKKRIEKLGRERGVLAVAAYDGMELDLSELHRVNRKVIRETTLDRWTGSTKA
jgi:ribonuclease BN (tRNA processing enzyme)